MRKPIAHFLIFALSLAACAPAATPPTPTLTASPRPASATPARTLTPTPLPTATRTPAPSATPMRAVSPTPSATYDTLRRTPPTLMLHKNNPDFDAVIFLKETIALLQAREFHVVTYQTLWNDPDLSAREAGQLYIITIDDIGLQAPIDPSILEMIELLRAAGYPAVLGIITTGKLADPQTAQTLTDLAAEGWELAMHTENHADLHELEKIAAYGARLEIRVCAEKIFAATGVQPITLVLPYGAMVEDLKILYRENVRWAVGIAAGEKYRTTNRVYYVGRDGPAGDAQFTFDVMLQRFNGE